MLFIKSQNDSKLRKPVCVFLVIVVLCAAFPVIYNLSVNCRYNHNASSVKITYEIDGTMLMHPASGYDELENIDPKDYQVYEIGYADHTIFKFKENDKPVKIDTAVEKYSVLDSKTCYKGDDGYYLIFSAQKNHYYPLTNKNHRFDRLYHYDISSGEMKEKYETKPGEYLLYADKDKIIYFDSFASKIMLKDSDDTSVIGEMEKQKKYKFRVLADRIKTDDREILFGE